MSEPILTKEAIALQADAAAKQFAGAIPGAEPPPNPYPIGSDAAHAWKVAFERYLLLHSAPEGEGSA